MLHPICATLASSQNVGRTAHKSEARAKQEAHDMQHKAADTPRSTVHHPAPGPAVSTYTYITCSICTTLIQPREHVRGRADHMAAARQHQLPVDHTGTYQVNIGPSAPSNNI